MIVRDDGAVTVIVAGIIAFGLLLAAAVGSVGAFLEARIGASAAADAAALAAAPVTFLPFGAAGSPSDEAERFATANGSRLIRCTCPVDRSWDPRTVIVEVERVAVLWPVGSIAVRSVGRAEFIPALLLLDD